MSSTDETAIEHGKLDRVVVGGVAWTAGAKWISQLLSWPSVLITARILTPADYGLVEMAGFYFIVTNVMAEFGLGMAVLQMRELNRAITAQLNTIAALTGIVAFILSAAAAPLLAEFFHAPPLRFLVVITSFSFILTSLEAVPLGLLQRDMEYRKLSVNESIQALITALVSVGFAFAGFGYWSLIAGNLLGRAGNIALAVYWRPVGYARPKWKEVSAPLRFGSEIAAQRIVSSMNGLSDGVIIGRVMGESLLGAYRLAINLANTPADKVGALVLRVTGPLFARVQSSTESMLRYYLILTEGLAIALFPMLFGLALVASDAVQLLLGSKWTAAIWPIRWLAIFAAFRMFSYLTNQMLTALRYTRLAMVLSFLNFLIMPFAFYIASHWSLGAVAASWLIMSPVTILPSMIKVFRSIRCGPVAFLKALAPGLVSAAVMCAGVFFLERFLAGLHGWQRLGAEVGIGGM
ncbi:MAG: lipopolysaccharide biosynthesis protein, partial [Acidobacteriota bacterium]|nr:lipopolysaccharide biosynthesis protein [Acidobacteriota bacterium]